MLPSHMKHIGEAGVIYLASIPSLILLASSSLEYFAISAQASLEEVKSFLDDLPFPLRFLYSSSSDEDIQKTYLEAPLFAAIFTRIAFSLIPAMVMLISIIPIIRREQLATIAIYMTLGILEVVSFIWALRFGIKLKRPRKK